MYLVKDMSKTFAHVNVVERDRKGLEHLSDTEKKKIVIKNCCKQGRLIKWNWIECVLGMSRR